MFFFLVRSLIKKLKWSSEQTEIETTIHNIVAKKTKIFSKENEEKRNKSF